MNFAEKMLRTMKDFAVSVKKLNGKMNKNVGGTSERDSGSMGCDFDRVGCNCICNVRNAILWSIVVL